MRQFIAAAAAVSLFAIILIKSGVSSALVLFLMLGAVPGTSYSLSPVLMFALVVASVWLAVFSATKLVYLRRLARS